MEYLFGEYCSGRVFSHDQEMRSAIAERLRSKSLKRRRDSLDSDEGRSSRSTSVSTSPERYYEPSIAEVEIPETEDLSDTGSMSDLPSTDTPIRKIRSTLSEQWTEILSARGGCFAGPSFSGAQPIPRPGSQARPSTDTRQPCTSHRANGTRQSPIELDDDSTEDEEEKTDQDSSITNGKFLEGKYNSAPPFPVLLRASQPKHASKGLLPLRFAFSKRRRPTCVSEKAKLMRISE